MNRENKRKTFQKGYYRNHACNEVFICKSCGWEVVPSGAGWSIRRRFSIVQILVYLYIPVYL